MKMITIMIMIVIMTIIILMTILYRCCPTTPTWSIHQHSRPAHTLYHPARIFYTVQRPPPPPPPPPAATTATAITQPPLHTITNNNNTTTTNNSSSLLVLLRVTITCKGLTLQVCLVYLFKTRGYPRQILRVSFVMTVQGLHRQVCPLVPHPTPTLTFRYRITYLPPPAVAPVPAAPVPGLALSSVLTVQAALL